MRVYQSISVITVLSAAATVSAFVVTPNIYGRGLLSLEAIKTGGRAPPNSSGRGRGPPTVDRPPMNEEIQANELRVVTPNPKGKDEPLGIMSRAEALAKAEAMGGLDLILVNENSDPPVCKIVDYSKYRYMQEKKAKEVKKNSKATEIKEVKMSYKIDLHDYDVRKKSAAKFLSQGNRVKCTVMFRGREVQHDNLGFELLDKLAEELEDVATKESGRPKREGKNLSLILSPRAEVLKAVNEKRRAEEKEKKKKKQSSFEERLATKATSVTSAGVTAADGLNGDSEETVIDMESSLDDLLGGSDDLTDDIFS